MTAPVRTRWGRIGSLGLGVWAVLGFVFLFTPIVVSVLFSFNEPEGKYNYIWNHFSLSAWTNPFEYEDLTKSLRYSLTIAVIVTLIATIIGTLMGLAMVKYRFRAKGVLSTILILPLTMPEIVMGFSLLSLFVAMDVTRNMWTIVIAQVVFSISYVATTVRARIRGFDWRLEEAALDLGASPVRTFTKVTLPLILPGVVAAALLTFALSLDDFIITYLNSGLDNTFPIQIWNMKRSRIPVQINVFSTAILIVSILFAVAVVVAGHRRERRMSARSATLGR